MPDLVGQTLGKYQLTDRLGRGGMADVYKAYQPGLERYVAIKVLHPHLAEQPDFVTRFKREARSVSALHHPNIVQVFDFDVQDDNYYMAMAYIEGGHTLKEVLHQLAQDEQRMPVEQALDLAAKVADALEYAHHQGMIHRDVKPANILMQSPDHPILSDFGIAHLMDATTLTRSGAMVGTPAYMAPEQGSGGKVSERSDIYSLGVSLYEMLTGRPPYDADTPYGVIIKHISDPLIPPHVIVPLPLIVEPVVLKALAKNPDDRFSSASEMAKALREVLADIREQGEASQELPDVRPDVLAQPAPAASTETPPLAARTVSAASVSIKDSPTVTRSVAQGARTLALAIGGLLVAAALVWYFVLGGNRTAIPPAPPGTIFAADIEGTVQLIEPGQPPRLLKTGDTVAVGTGGPGTALKVVGAGRAVISLDDGSVLYLGPVTTLGLDSLVDPTHNSTGTLLNLQVGALLAKVASLPGTTFVVETPVGTRADVSGSLMGTQYAPDLEQFDVDCLEGHCRKFGGPGIPPLALTACQHSLVVSIGAPEGPDQARSGQWRSLFGDVVPDCPAISPASALGGPLTPTSTRVPLVPTFTPIFNATPTMGGSPTAMDTPASLATTASPATVAPVVPTDTVGVVVATLVPPTSTLAPVVNTLVPPTSTAVSAVDTAVPAVDTAVPAVDTAVPSVSTSLPPVKQPTLP